MFQEFEMTESDMNIWGRRAAEEAEAALSATSPEAARAHGELAAAYRERASGDDPMAEDEVRDTGT